MQDANNDEDEDTHSDQCDGRHQHTVARSQVQFSAPTKERESVRKNKFHHSGRKKQCIYQMVRTSRDNIQIKIK